MSLYLPFLPARDLTRETAKQGKESHRVNTKQSCQYVPSLKGSFIKLASIADISCFELKYAEVFFGRRSLKPLTPQHHQMSQTLQTRCIKKSFFFRLLTESVQRLIVIIQQYEPSLADLLFVWTFFLLVTRF